MTVVVCLQSGVTYWKRERRWSDITDWSDIVKEDVRALDEAEKNWRVKSHADSVALVDGKKLGEGVTKQDRKDFEKLRARLRRNLTQSRSKFCARLLGTVHACTSRVCQLRSSDESEQLRCLLPEDVWETWRLGMEGYGRGKPEFILSFLRYSKVASMNVSENRAIPYPYGPAKIPMCWICFCAMHGVNALSAEKVPWNFLHEGAPTQAVMTSVVREAGQMNREIQQFIGEHYEFLAQWDPEGRRVTIPADVKFNVWHRWYGAYCKHHKLKQAHYSYFCAVWRMCFYHVKMTDKTKFSQCKECARLNHQLSRVGLSMEARFKRDLFAAKCAHVEYVRCIRRVIQYFWIHACHYPRALLFWNCDRMDALKTMIPNPHRDEKNYEYEGKLGTSVHCTVTNIGDFFAISDKVMPKHCAACRQHVDMQTLQVVRRALGHELPKYVVIVEDNAKENKNHLRKFLWAFLVASGVFDKVEFLFLIVGHTHGPVDRRFGRISTIISGRDILTPSDLTSVLCNLASEISGPHAQQIRHFAWWVLSFPDLDSFWETMPRLWTSVRAIPMKETKRMIITRVDATTEDNHLVHFECHENVLRPKEIAKTYGRGSDAGDDNGRCGSIFGDILENNEFSAQSRQCRSLMAFAKWWREKMCAPKPGRTWTVDFSDAMAEKMTFWPGRVIDKINRTHLMKRLEEDCLLADGSWGALLAQISEREKYECGECAEFSIGDKQLKSSEGMCASTVGNNVHKSKQSERRKHLEAWASHRAEAGHAGLSVWSLSAMHSMITRGGTALSNENGFSLMTFTRRSHDAENANPWPSIRDMRPIPAHFLDSEWSKHMPESLADEVNSHARMLACSGFFEARWETLTRMDHTLSLGDATFNQDIIRDAASYVNNIGVWNVHTDSRFEVRKCVCGL